MFWKKDEDILILYFRRDYVELREFSALFSKFNLKLSVLDKDLMF